MKLIFNIFVFPFIFFFVTYSSYAIDIQKTSLGGIEIYLDRSKGCDNLTFSLENKNINAYTIDWEINAEDANNKLVTIFSGRTIVLGKELISQRTNLTCRKLALYKNITIRVLYVKGDLQNPYYNLYNY
ncbi:MAG: hypothetical protein LBH34_00630 [Prevotellaceae bacterium]|jgi:hypothetical protein|nr:hypothetical protein [Prevotellaceae bacterium]